MICVSKMWKTVHVFLYFAVPYVIMQYVPFLTNSFGKSASCLHLRVLCVCARACDRWVERRAQCAAGLSRLCRFSRFIAAAAGPSSVARYVAPAPVRVRRMMRTMMEESESIPCAAEDGLLSGWRWNRTARDQVQIKQKIRDLPGLLKHGLNLRKKTVSYPPSRPLERINKPRTTR